MFGLLSDLDEAKWKESDAPAPSNKKTMAGGTYAMWGIVKFKEEVDHFNYFLNSDSGAPNQAKLFYAKRNLLNEAGHCWMTFVEVGVGNLVTGIAIEDDWVVMKPDAIDEMKQKYGPRKAEEEREGVVAGGGTMDMGIYGDLVPDNWEKKDSPRGQIPPGYQYCEIIRSGEVDPHTFDIYLSDDGNPSTATITNVLRNPFSAVTKGHFKIVDGLIKGVITEDSWVEMM